jgi:hypothetical protein
MNKKITSLMSQDECNKILKENPKILYPKNSIYCGEHFIENRTEVLDKIEEYMSTGHIESDFEIFLALYEVASENENKDAMNLWIKLRDNLIKHLNRFPTR